MISKLSLTNFRKFDLINLDLNSNLIIFEGSNAIGKTSILESIYLVSTLKSERVNQLNYLIKENKPFSKVVLEDSDNTYQIVLSNESKKCFINNVEIKRSRDFIGNLYSIYFSPQDLNLITGSPNNRRHFLDLELSILNKKYLDTLSNAKYYLKQRNDALKSNADKSIINLLTDSLISEEIKISKSRIKFLNLLNEKLNNIHSTISNGERLELKYVVSYDLENTKDFYNANYEKDKLLKTTTKGFHRDDFKIYLNNLEAQNFASQGQIRNIALSIKLALVELYESYLGKSPLLLLDDVFSELDNKRQENLIRFLLNRDQTFITTTSLESIPKVLLENAKIIKLEEIK